MNIFLLRSSEISESLFEPWHTSKILCPQDQTLIVKTQISGASKTHTWLSSYPISDYILGNVCTEIEKILNDSLEVKHQLL